MTKKFLLSIFLICTTLFFLCLSNTLATEAITASEAEVSTATNETSTTQATTQEPEIHKDDLYILGNNVVMDKLVDGNVYILGNNVDFSGQVNGSLFILANTVNFNGACNDLYVCSNTLNMTYESFVIRNVKAIGISNITCKSAVGRDISLLCNTLSLGENEDIPLIHGNLNYIANKEISVPEGVMAKSGTVNYANNSLSIIYIVTTSVSCMATVIALYFIFAKFTPNYLEKLSNQKFSVTKLLKAFGIGIASLISVLILTIVLFITGAGIKLALILIVLYCTLSLISVPSLSIMISHMLKPTLKIEKNFIFSLTLALTNVILYGITLIPFIGKALSFIIKMISIGLLIKIILPSKESSSTENSLSEETQKDESTDVIHIYKNENNLPSIIIAIILVVLLILVFNIPNLIQSYEMLTTDSNTSNSSPNVSQEPLNINSEATINVQN